MTVNMGIENVAELYTMPKDLKCYTDEKFSADMEDLLKESRRVGVYLAGQARNFAHQYTKIDLCDRAIEEYKSKAFPGRKDVPDAVISNFEAGFWENSFQFDLIYEPTD